nr:hypothetical protein [Bacteroidota bacterium]
ILKYFPEESMIIIDPANPEEAMRKILFAMSDNRWEKNLAAIKKARELILKEYQFFPAITKKIQQYKDRMPDKKWHYVPQNIKDKDLDKTAILINNFKLKFKNLNA